MQGGSLRRSDTSSEAPTRWGLTVHHHLALWLCSCVRWLRYHVCDGGHVAAAAHDGESCRHRCERCEHYCCASELTLARACLTARRRGAEAQILGLAESSPARGRAAAVACAACVGSDVAGACAQKDMLLSLVSIAVDEDGSLPEKTLAALMLPQVMTPGRVCAAWAALDNEQALGLQKLVGHAWWACAHVRPCS